LWTRHHLRPRRCIFVYIPHDSWPEVAFWDSLRETRLRPAHAQPPPLGLGTFTTVRVNIWRHVQNYDYQHEWVGITVLILIGEYPVELRDDEESAEIHRLTTTPMPKEPTTEEVTRHNLTHFRTNHCAIIVYKARGRPRNTYTL
jgi:hypothetical protein